MLEKWKRTYSGLVTSCQSSFIAYILMELKSLVEAQRSWCFLPLWEGHHICPCFPSYSQKITSIFFRNICRNNLPLFSSFGVIFETQEELSSFGIRVGCYAASADFKSHSIVLFISFMCPSLVLPMDLYQKTLIREILLEQKLSWAWNKLAS